MTMVDHEQLRAELDGFTRGHGRAYTFQPGGVRAGCDHTPTLWTTTHSKSFSDEGWIKQFFDRTEESIEVKVKDLACHINELACYQASDL